MPRFRSPNLNLKRHHSYTRYKIVLYIPRTLKILNIDTHAIAQIKFDPNAKIQHDSFLIQTYEIVMVLPTERIKANHLDIADDWVTWQ